MSDRPCPRCDSTETRVILGPHPGGHYSKILCADCNAFKYWGKKPDSEKPKSPRAEVSKTLVQQYSRGFCEICLRPSVELPLPETLEGHHVIPVTEQGTDDRENIQIVCTACHRWIHHQRTYLGHYHRKDGRVA